MCRLRSPCDPTLAWPRQRTPLYFAGSAMFNVNGGGNNVQLDARTASGPQLQVMCCTQLATNTCPRGPRSWQGVGRQQVIRMLANKGVPKKRRDDHLVLS